MQVTSTYRFARISAFKAREVTREIQGRSASDALDLLAFSPKKAAVLVRKTLRSAIANAENNAELKVDSLLVKEAVVGHTGEREAGHVETEESSHTCVNRRQSLNIPVHEMVDGRRRRRAVAAR